MVKDEGMPKLDLAKDNVNPTTLQYIKNMESYNLARVAILKKTRRRSNLLSCGLALSVVGTYLYSMYAVRQEGFLDDFEEPKMKST